MLSHESMAQVVSRRQRRVLCSPFQRVFNIRGNCRALLVVAGCTFRCVAPSFGPARRAGSNEHSEHSRLRSTVGSCRRWHARWRIGSQVLPRCNGSWSVLGATAACSLGCDGVKTSQVARPVRRTQPMGSFSKGGVLACTGGVVRRG